MSTPLASFGDYEVRLNRRRTLVFITSPTSQRSRTLSPLAALDPTTEVAIGVTIPADVRAAIAAVVPWQPCGLRADHAAHDLCSGRQS